MICTFETLPNEILLIIFSYLSWLEMLTSLWSLNNRINYLICSIVSKNDNKKTSGLIIKESGLSYNKCYSRLFPLFNHSSLLSFCSCIRRMCFDGTNSIACDINYEWIFFQNNNKKILRFPNLESLIVTQCWLSESLIENLSLLIRHQLDELTLIFDKEMFNSLRYENPSVKKNYGRSNY
ncbi:unnamed protein product [Rotaria sp. Silwood2]|nr:unnamed protein product [Rotaria sp. Silwood2]CAF3467297.1 unnamed protein product [Rotaria sp. Silwood2]CAF4632411.1 unnamed protein product [Rotaria sp. Silwood2]